MYFHLIILAVYTVFLGCLTANTIYLGHRESAESLSHARDNASIEAEWCAVDKSEGNYVRIIHQKANVHALIIR